jgi:hypothetical protein
VSSSYRLELFTYYAYVVDSLWAQHVIFGHDAKWVYPYVQKKVQAKINSNSVVGAEGYQDSLIFIVFLP